ncbi:MAG: CoA-binding protein [Ignavibacteriales bacterium]|nr:CoA-binding protein [Ignavibacteriales bacterium]
MDKQIENMVSEKTFVLGGVSSDVKKFGNYILKELTARGFTIYPVHPSLQMVEGVKCYKTLDLVAGLTPNLIVCVKPERAALLVKEAKELLGSPPYGFNKVRGQKKQQKMELRPVFMLSQGNVS